MSKKLDEKIKNILENYDAVDIEKTLIANGFSAKFAVNSPSGGKKLRDGDVYKFKPKKGWTGPTIATSTGIVTWKSDSTQRNDRVLEIKHADGTTQTHKMTHDITVTLIFGTTFVWPENAEVT